MVVEDNEFNLDMLLDVLKIRNYEIFIARDGKTGITLAHTQKPDPILMDLNMPVMGGLEAARLLRDMEEFSTTPIVALSADADTESIDECIAAGYSHHVSKPFRVAELFKVIDECLNTDRQLP